jgi:hypothetical protein
MPNYLLVLVTTAAFLTGCQKSSAPSSTVSAQAKSGDAVQQKMQELAGSGATDCGRVKSQSPDEVKPASDCALEAAKNKRAFYVAYDLPGMTVGTAGNSEGKLFGVQMEQPEGGQPATAEVRSMPCPAELRVAQSGRVTCSTPGSMGMGGMGGASPHGGGMSMPPEGTQSPHRGTKPAGDGKSKPSQAPPPTKQH